MTVENTNAIRIWGRLSSSNVQAVLWCLAELDLPFERINAGYTHGVVDKPDYLAMNPNGLVPTLIDSSAPPLFETGAILRYLAGQYARESFWPSDPVARGQTDKWAEWVKINIALTFIAPVFWPVVRTAPSRQNPETIATNLKTLEKYLRIADDRLEVHQYLAGSDFTLANIQMGHCLYRYFDIAIERPHLPNLRRYYDLLFTRPAYREYVRADCEELWVTDD
jgi:glutathione S-transferase